MITSSIYSNIIVERINLNETSSSKKKSVLSYSLSVVVYIIVVDMFVPLSYL